LYRRYTYGIYFNIDEENQRETIHKKKKKKKKKMKRNLFCFHGHPKKKKETT